MQNESRSSVPDGEADNDDSLIYACFDYRFSLQTRFALAPGSVNQSNLVDGSAPHLWDQTVSWLVFAFIKWRLQQEQHQPCAIASRL